ncbi:5-dehydro-4-deoxy-D-glucuronate isomerase [Vibrio sp. ZSDZ65]|uniref:4-deoxy-L-threo-5-hexosulose-uronate ketol-isomerase n=1 Tax=Vibrio qingdaonensis TaxID=2829491 RepID=A0A9X3CMC3_9VIBR|nr:5-dehydro-4-deoxy-D-glucuronate isomerase [Vibrio qingdaonensis]MCW8345886.1 5-dehydro-4-deoxy-D-glucuronate isomerase [Vibrio qingdaonensis]
MKVNYNSNPKDSKSYDTSRLREEYLTDSMFIEDEIVSVYSHIDRIVVLGVSPTTSSLTLEDHIDSATFGVDYFLQRREFGVVNVGGRAQVKTATGTYTINHLDGLYLGMGTQELEFSSLDADCPALLYCISAPAHHTYPSRVVKREETNLIQLGDSTNANERVIRQYLHPDILPTCQLSMGVTSLSESSVWNTMPAHTHERRMEAYFYFDIKPQQVVFHFMGEPTETRHVVLRNHQMILSPSWSIHSGCGTQNYSFIWGMLGENQTFDDMDFVDMDAIK